VERFYESQQNATNLNISVSRVEIARQHILGVADMLYIVLLKI